MQRLDDDWRPFRGGNLDRDIALPQKKDLSRGVAFGEDPVVGAKVLVARASREQFQGLVVKRPEDRVLRKYLLDIIYADVVSPRSVADRPRKRPLPP
ncbi:hypothetical protein [Halovulum marinum]|uniref:hypothetical protein n=1 Tax=Halovulum marinum TaxID=2662447 RepID=UPI002D79DE22|nr:hypothetical protein [Halovulum marinum]